MTGRAWLPKIRYKLGCDAGSYKGQLNAEKITAAKAYLEYLPVFWNQRRALKPGNLSAESVQLKIIKTALETFLNSI